MADLIADYMRHCKQAGLARHTTIPDREELLRRVDVALPMGLIKATTEEIGDWLANDKWSPKTRCTYYEHVIALFKWLRMREHIDYDPTSGLARPRTYRRAPKPVPEDQLGQILDKTSGFWLLAAELAAFEGLRCCEVATIKREEITSDYLTIQGKGGTELAVPTHGRVWESVKDFPPGPLAVTVLGREVSPNYVSQTFPRAVKHATGLDGVTLHRLRHRFGTMLLTPKELGGAGYDLRTTQELMRHASPNQTAVYTQITDRQRRLAIEALPVPSSAPC